MFALRSDTDCHAAGHDDGPGMVWRGRNGGFNHWQFGAACVVDDPGLFSVDVLFYGKGAPQSHRPRPRDTCFLSRDQTIARAVFRHAHRAAGAK